MALGGKVYDAVNLIFPYDAAHLVKVGYVGLNERVVWLVLDILEVGKVACISQFVEVDDMVVGILVDE